MNFPQFSWLLSFSAFFCGITFLQAHTQPIVHSENEVYRQLETANDTVIIKGVVTNGIGVPMANVRVAASDLMGVSFKAVTKEDGTYCLKISQAGKYSLHLYKWSDPNNGVTAADLVEARKILLQVTEYDPYQQLSGDIDLDGVITTVDLVQLQKFSIFGVQFTPQIKDFNFTHPISSTQSPVSIDRTYFEYDTAEGNVQKDFVGFKVGDINYSAEY